MARPALRLSQWVRHGRGRAGGEFGVAQSTSGQGSRRSSQALACACSIARQTAMYLLKGPRRVVAGPFSRNLRGTASFVVGHIDEHP